MSCRFVNIYRPFGGTHCFYIKDNQLKMRAASCSKLGTYLQIYMRLYPSGFEVHRKISTEIRANCLHLDGTPLFFIFSFPCGRHSSMHVPTRLRPGWLWSMGSIRGRSTRLSFYKHLPGCHRAFYPVILRTLSLTRSGPQKPISCRGYECMELFLYFPIRLHSVVHI